MELYEHMQQITKKWIVDHIEQAITNVLINRNNRTTTIIKTNEDPKVTLAIYISQFSYLHHKSEWQFFLTVSTVSNNF